MSFGIYLHTLSQCPRRRVVEMGSTERIQYAVTGLRTLLFWDFAANIVIDEYFMIPNMLPETS